MIPAYAIGLYLNLPVCDLVALISNSEIKTGHTRNVKKRIERPLDAKRILIVDDSIQSGRSMREDTALINLDNFDEITTLAIYSDKKKRNDVDIFLEYIPTPRIFEWNIFHHKWILSRSCIDIDGVLCEDPSKEQNDDGEKYIEFIRNARPLFIPTVKIGALVTNRLEKYREETEEWLKKLNIDYEELFMLNEPSQKARRERGNYGENKAKIYSNIKFILFIESENNQSKVICEKTGKYVYCTATNTMHVPGMVSRAKTQGTLS